MKILIIGQAPAAVSQTYPYDTTMLYTWLEEVGINKEDAQNIFDFDAVSNVFPGFSIGGHKPPTKEAMDKYFIESLGAKIYNTSKLIILGNVAKDYLTDRLDWGNIAADKKIIYLIHPSRRNLNLYNKNKDSIIQKLRSIVEY